MSKNQNQSKSKTPTKKEAPKRSGKKTIIIIAAAVLVVAAGVLAAIFIPKLKNSKLENTTGASLYTGQAGYTDHTSGGGSDEPVDSGIASDKLNKKHTYETAQYKGFTVPASFAEYLTAADNDTKKAAKKYGTAMTIGDHAVSVPEFTMHYCDIYVSQAGYADANNVFLGTVSVPSEQKYSDTDRTWADELRNRTEKTIYEDYILFSEALRAGLMPTDEAVAGVEETYDTYQKYLSANYESHEQGMSNIYSDGVTFNMYMASEVMRAYIAEYTAVINTSYSEKITDDMLKKEFETNSKNYTHVDIRITPLMSLTDELKASAYAAIKDEKSFIKFFLDNSIDGITETDIDLDTDWKGTDYKNLTVRFGKKIADWVYSDKCKEGKFEIVSSDYTPCAVLVLRKPYTDGSVSFMRLQSTDIEALNKLAEEFDKTDKTQQEFEQMCLSQTADEYYFENQYRSGLEFAEANWLFSKSTKPGDSIKITMGSSYAELIYLVSRDDDNADWKYFCRVTLMDNYYQDYFERLKGQNTYAMSAFAKQINDAVNAGEVYCKKHIPEESQQAQ